MSYLSFNIFKAVQHHDWNLLNKFWQKYFFSLVSTRILDYIKFSNIFNHIMKIIEIVIMVMIIMIIKTNKRRSILSKYYHFLYFLPRTHNAQKLAKFYFSKPIIQQQLFAYSISCYKLLISFYCFKQTLFPVP